MLKINKDIVFMLFLFIWLIGNITEYILTNEVIFVNWVMIFILFCLILIKNTNNRFNDWLEREL